MRKIERLNLPHCVILLWEGEIALSSYLTEEYSTSYCFHIFKKEHQEYLKKKDIKLLIRAIAWEYIRGKYKE